MKKTILFMMVATMFVTSCQKEKPTPTPPVAVGIADTMIIGSWRTTETLPCSNAASGGNISFDDNGDGNVTIYGLSVFATGTVPISNTFSTKNTPNGSSGVEEIVSGVMLTDSTLIVTYSLKRHATLPNCYWNIVYTKQ